MRTQSWEGVSLGERPPEVQGTAASKGLGSSHTHHQDSSTRSGSPGPALRRHRDQNCRARLRDSQRALPVLPSPQDLWETKKDRGEGSEVCGWGSGRSDMNLVTAAPGDFRWLSVVTPSHAGSAIQWVEEEKV